MAVWLAFLSGIAIWIDMRAFFAPMGFPAARILNGIALHDTGPATAATPGKGIGCSWWTTAHRHRGNRSMEIGEEIAKHLEWIELVSSLIGEEGLSDEKREEISRHDLCALGAWLDSSEAKRFEPSEVLTQVRERHEKFHRLAGELMAAIEGDKASAAVSIQETLIQTSQSLIEGLIALRDGESSNKP